MNSLQNNGAVSIYEDLSVVIGKHPDIEVNPLHLAKFHLTNVKQTSVVLLKGRLKRGLDPIVGEDTCQGRALFHLLAYSDPTLMNEAKTLLTSVAKQLQRLNGEAGRQGVGINRYQDHEIGAHSLLGELEARGYSCFVSERMSYLLRSHLLTVGKYFAMTAEGRETSGINRGTLRKALNCRLDLDRVDQIVHAAREKIASMTIDFLQQQREPLPQLQDRYIRTIQRRRLQLRCSAALFNLKAVLQEACARQIPILLGEHKGAPHRLYYRSPAPGAEPLLYSEKLTDKQELLVFEGFFPEEPDLGKRIEQQGVISLLLANVSFVPQYSVDDNFSLLDEASQQEILKYRELGRQLRCDTALPALFRIAHIHASTVQEEQA